MALQNVRDVMTPDPLTVSPDLSVTEAALLMVENSIGSLPVLEEGRLIGIVTEGDLIMQDVKLQFPTYLHLLDGYLLYPPATARFESELRKAVAATVRDVMTADPITIDIGATVEDAATLLVEREVSRLPVLEGGRLVGIMSKRDVIRALVVGEE